VIKIYIGNLQGRFGGLIEPFEFPREIELFKVHNGDCTFQRQAKLKPGEEVKILQRTKNLLIYFIRTGFGPIFVCYSCIYTQMKLK